MSVCFRGYDEVANYLIKKGENVDIINRLGVTALVYATIFNMVNIVEMLIS